MASSQVKLERILIGRVFRGLMVFTGSWLSSLGVSLRRSENTHTRRFYRGVPVVVAVTW